MNKLNFYKTLRIIIPMIVAIILYLSFNNWFHMIVGVVLYTLGGASLRTAYRTGELKKGE